MNGVKYGVKADYWSLGVLLYALLGGKFPFWDDNMSILYKKIVNGLFEFDDSLWDNISDSCKDFIGGLLEVNPDKRMDIRKMLSHRWIVNSLKMSKIIRN